MQRSSESFGERGGASVERRRMSANIAWIAAHVPQFPELLVLVGLLRQVGAAEAWPWQAAVRKLRRWLGRPE